MVNFRYYHEATKQHVCPTCDAQAGENCERTPPGHHETRIYAAWNDDNPYRDLADHIIKKLNPAEDDASEYSLLVNAIDLIADYTATEVCECKYDDEADEQYQCGRCKVLGQYKCEQIEW